MYRAIPSIDKCVKTLIEMDASLQAVQKSLLADLASSFWDRKRQEIKDGTCKEQIDLASQLTALHNYVREYLKPVLGPVLNGTGVIIHTNLGRSILAKSACEAMLGAGRDYCNLELDLKTGSRGSRNFIIRDLVCRLTGAEDAQVVNNNAAAVLLILDTLCSSGETIVSRGELVEIGGSFRIPDIMRKSGASLVEVGTTNRTNIDDYRNAITDQTRAIMRVHASNFRIIGFHATPGLRELNKLAKEYKLPLFYDLGSGSLLDFTEYGLKGEPTVREILAQGADLVSFSGDKALGGPQAGIIAGKAALVEKLRKNPLARALRCDKLCLAALEATLRLYLDPDKARLSIPTLAMITMSGKTIEKNASLLARGLRQSFAASNIKCKIKLRKDNSQAGGGSFPEQGLETTLVCICPENLSPQELRARLLDAPVPIVGRLEKDAFCLDPRTLDRKDYKLLISEVTQVLQEQDPTAIYGA